MNQRTTNASHPPIDPALRRRLSAILRQLNQPDEHVILTCYFGTLRGQHAQACTLAWYHIEQYLVSAQRQVQRIDRGRRMIEWMFARAEQDRLSRRLPTGSPPGKNIWADAHFYFICWHMIGCLLWHIEGICKLRHLSQFMRTKRTLIERYIEARHHLEHWVERLPGGLKADILKLPHGSKPEHRAPGGYYF